MSVAIAAAAGIQAIGQIQNARFQADLVAQQNKDRMREAEFAATERELELERNRLNLAIEERERMRAANKTIGNLIAKPLTVDITPVYQSHVADLVEDLAIIRTDEQIMAKKTQAGIHNLMSNVYAQNRVDTSMAKANRQAAYVSAATTMAGGYMNYQYLSAGSASNLNLNSTATMSAGQLDMAKYSNNPFNYSKGFKGY